MLQYKSIVSLTIDEAKALLEPRVIKTLFPGELLESLTQIGGARLVDALSSPEMPADVWKSRLVGLHVPLLDVNQVPSTVLARVTGGSAEFVNLLVEARPYFSLADLNRENSVLCELAKQAAPYLTHEGYWFQDKPRGRLVELFPVDTGVIVRYRHNADLGSTRAVLQEAGLITISDEHDERLMICRWHAEASERSARLFVLKRSDPVETIAPFLRDEEGQERFVYPDRLDLTLHREAEEVHWNEITTRHDLQTVQRYRANYGSVRVRASPHDLGCLYRTLRILVNEPLIHYVEPSYLTF